MKKRRKSFFFLREACTTPSPDRQAIPISPPETRTTPPHNRDGKRFRWRCLGTRWAMVYASAYNPLVRRPHSIRSNTNKSIKIFLYIFLKNKKHALFFPSKGRSTFPYAFLDYSQDEARLVVVGIANKVVHRPFDERLNLTIVRRVVKNNRRSG